MALALTACSASPPALLKANGVERVSAEQSDYPAELAQLRVSARKLGAALLADGGDSGNGNVVASPGSLLIALAMLRTGATGKTAAEMDRTLGLPADHRDEAMSALLASLEAFDGDPGSVDEKNPPRQPVLHSANGLFVDKGVPTGEDYLHSLARYYGTGVYPVDFQDQAATEPAIDAWVDKNTGGRIKKAPAEYDRKNTSACSTRCISPRPGRSPSTRPTPPNCPSQRRAAGRFPSPPCPAFRTLPQFRVRAGRRWSCPTPKGFVMRLVLPDAGAAAPGAEVFADVAQALDSAAPSPTQLYLPRWDHKSSFELRKVFASLGLREMLQTETDFNSIQPGLRIKQAGQSANITVAEKGTVAAAVTQINAEASSGAAPMKVIRFDRPFLYEIVHVETGLPLFMGTVADPRP